MDKKAAVRKQTKNDLKGNSMCKGPEGRRSLGYSKQPSLSMNDYYPYFIDVETEACKV